MPGLRPEEREIGWEGKEPGGHRSCFPLQPVRPLVAQHCKGWTKVPYTIIIIMLGIVNPHVVTRHQALSKALHTLTNYSFFFNFFKEMIIASQEVAKILQGVPYFFAQLPPW